MATQNVRFYFGNQAKYDALTERNPLALYFIEDTKRLYKGDVLMATGSDATAMASGLMSMEDKIKLDSIVETALSGLVPVDGSIVITEGKDGGKTIGVAISAQSDNALISNEDGLFVPVAKEIDIPEYAMEKQDVADEGFAASYKLKKTVNGESIYVGDTINIARDMVLQSAVMKTVEENNVPYDGAIVGEPYIEMIFNDESTSALYIPMKGLVDTHTAGEGIEIVEGKISVKIASESNGLQFVDGTLSLALATVESAGALSPVDKAFIDSIPNVYASKKFVKATCEQEKYEISGTPYGTIVNYGENEIRVMCPNNVEFVKQNVGVGGDANSYYMTFKTYAPNDNIVGYIEHIGDQADAEILTDLKTDGYGRKYQPTWLSLAKYDNTSGAWNYLGKNSTEEKCIGWDYQIDWYDANGVMVASDAVRINLTNEDCHHSTKPNYMNDYATIEQLNAIEESLTGSFTWGEL